MKKIEFKQHILYFEDEVPNESIMAHMTILCALNDILNETWSCSWTLEGNIITISGDEDRHEIVIDTIVPIKLYDESNIPDFSNPGPIR